MGSGALHDGRSLVRDKITAARMAADIVRSKLNFLGGFDDYLCRDSLGIHVSATYVLNGGCQSLKRTVGTVLCG